MKQTLTMILSVLLCIALVAGAVCLGAVRGWRSERETASVTSADPQRLEERTMDAANLLVVASRHLPAEDPTLAALRDARQVLLSSTAAVEEIIAADAALTAAAQALADALPALPSIQASQRDQAYIASLTGILAVDTGAAESHRQQIAAFNQRLQTSLTGKLAMLLGVEPLPQ